MHKRQRFTKTAPRPIDKRIIVVDQAIVASQTSTTIFTSAFPCTIVGIRWSLNMRTDLASSFSEMVWAIVMVEDGDTVGALSRVDGADFYTPEQNCLVFSAGSFPDNDAGNGPNTRHWEDSTKTMRKFKVGDQLRVIALGLAASQEEFFGVVQFFCKT